MSREFARYIGIDYSGAETPDARLKGLRVFACEPGRNPWEVAPEAGRYWSRMGIAHWLERELAMGPRTAVGLDHGFSFPLAYFEQYGLSGNWEEFVRDFLRAWPTGRRNMYVDFIREGVDGNGASRMGDSRWRRVCEMRTGGAKSVFHFDVPGSVAKSTFAGLPWLLYLRERVRRRLHFWPFDGWKVAAGRSVVAEAYPALYKDAYPDCGLEGDQRDAYAIAAWLRDRDAAGEMGEVFEPGLSGEDLRAGRVEGWILGAR
jgi:hypothetical protein